MGEIEAKYKKRNKAHKQYRDHGTYDIHQLREDYGNLQIRWEETEKKIQEIENKKGMTTQEKINEKWKQIHKKMKRIIKERYERKIITEKSLLQIEEEKKNRVIRK